MYSRTFLSHPVVGPDSLTEYCRSELGLGKHSIICPSQSCDREWSYSVVRQVAPPTEVDLQLFDVTVTENYFRSTAGFQKCPRCSVWSYREPKPVTAIGKTLSLVVCPLCTKMRPSGSPYEYCWYCHNERKSGESNHCGNADCLTSSGIESRIAYMMSCPLITIYRPDGSGTAVVGCPSVRACPVCSFLHEFIGGCKHMPCVSCGSKFKFCFFCLKYSEDGKVPCNPWEDNCQLAPMQTSLSLTTKLPK